MMPVKRFGLSKFLEATFIDNPSGAITPKLIVNKLSSFPDTGQVVYNRAQSAKCPLLKYINVKILQLIASGII